MENNVKSTEKLYKLGEYKTSKFCFLFPILASIILFSYLISSIGKIDTFTTGVILISSTIFFIQPFFCYKNQKIILTNKKIFVNYGTSSKNQIKWDLIFDLAIVQYRQDLIGKICNYGELILVDKNNKFVNLKYIENVNLVGKKIINVSNIYLKQEYPELEIEIDENENNGIGEQKKQLDEVR